MISQRYNKLKVPGRVTTPFMGRTRGEAQHPGLDIANLPGSPVPAFSDGQVTSVGPTTNGMGNIVTLKDKEGNTHQYGHLQGALVKPGAVVKKGQTIAKMGATGNSYSPSGGDATHLDIRIADAYGRWKNPSAFLNKK